MSALEWIRLAIGVVLIIFGMITFFTQIYGVFKFKYAMNRMHAAAMGDTLGVGAAILGIVFLNGINLTSLKLMVVILFLWFASPVSSHLIAYMEIMTNSDKNQYEDIADVRTLDSKEEQ